MRTRIALTVLISMVFFPIFYSSIKHAAETPLLLYSPALIPCSNLRAEPEELGALVFKHSEGILTDDEVRQIAKGLALLEKEKEGWVLRFLEGYHSERK
jgi:hypothetical protein